MWKRRWASIYEYGLCDDDEINYLAPAELIFQVNGVRINASHRSLYTYARIDLLTCRNLYSYIYYIAIAVPIYILHNMYTRYIKIRNSHTGCTIVSLTNNQNGIYKCCQIGSARSKSNLTAESRAPDRAAVVGFARRTRGLVTSVQWISL